MAAKKSGSGNRMSASALEQLISGQLSRRSRPKAGSRSSRASTKKARMPVRKAPERKPSRRAPSIARRASPPPRAPPRPLSVPVRQAIRPRVDARSRAPSTYQRPGLPERRHPVPQRAIPPRPMNQQGSVRRVPLDQPLMERRYVSSSTDMRRPFGDPFQGRRPQVARPQQREPAYEAPQSPFMRRRRFPQL